MVSACDPKQNIAKSSIHVCFGQTEHGSNGKSLRLTTGSFEVSRSLRLDSRALDQHLCCGREGVELVGEAIGADRLLKSGRDLAFRELPGIAARVHLEQIQLSGSGFPNDVHT